MDNPESLMIRFYQNFKMKRARGCIKMKDFVQPLKNIRKEDVAGSVSFVWVILYGRNRTV